MVGELGLGKGCGMGSKEQKKDHPFHTMQLG
jgi:hypothetical protein